MSEPVEAVAAFLWEVHGGSHLTWGEKPEQSREDWREEAAKLLALPEFQQRIEDERRDAVRYFREAIGEVR